VLCEKPIALDLASAEDLAATARQRGLFLMEGLWTRTLPAIRRLQEVVAEGAIGRVTAVYADFALGGPFPATHRLRARELGGGALLDLGVYPINFAHMFLGVPDRIAAVAALSPEGVDENTGLVLGYPGGGIAVLHCGLVGESPVAATVIGTGGRAVIAAGFFHANGFTLVRGDKVEEIQVPRRGNGLGYEAEEVMSCLAAGRTESDLMPVSTTLTVMRILDEARAQVGVTYP
jgi:predicted dehydrogenase